MNPAVLVALLILGKINGTQFVAAFFGEFLGAFLGAIFVWLHFLPHFKTVPTPFSITPDSILLRQGDPLTPTALGIGSYNIKEKDMAARRRGIHNIGHALEDIQYYLKNTFNAEEDVDAHAALMEVALGPHEAKQGAADAVASKLRRRSVQVCDVHRRLKDIDIEEFKSMLMTPHLHQPSVNYRSNTMTRSHSGSEATLTHGTDTAAVNNSNHNNNGNNAAVKTAVDKKEEQLDKLYDAAVVADQNVKLSIFATRPAIYSPIFNFLCEFMGTTMLIYGALMIYARRDQLYPAEYLVYRAEEGIWIGFFVFLCVLGLGGPTGYAANSARDFSPRLAHWLLPIPGKGPSEFYYAWIPFFAPLVGGCAAAGLYAATQLMNHSNLPKT